MDDGHHRTDLFDRAVLQTPQPWEMAAWIALVSSVLPSPLAPKSFTLRKELPC
eukprot:COSAG02_NODE_47362_length_341_cov_3.028926_1_plen_52_part_01